MAKRKFPTWGTNDIADIGNGDPNKADPGVDLQATGWFSVKPLLQHMNWILNLIGKFIKSNNSVIKVDNGYETEAGERIQVNNNSSIATILLPSEPEEGQWVEVGATDALTIYPVIVGGNGNDIMLSGDQSCTLDLRGIVFMFYWRNDINMWKIRKVNQDGVE